jgi:hypothetical protein
VHAEEEQGGTIFRIDPSGATAQRIKSAGSIAVIGSALRFRGR